MIERGPAPGSRPLPRLVYVLGMVSFCTDLASEMIVPLLPTLMTSLGASMLQLGLLQGASDLVVAMLKVLSGRLSDRQRRRRPWLLWGYGISSLLRPLFAFVGTPLQAISVRLLDRVGKGLRAAPRDALLTAAVPSDRRGHAFGVQRSLDHAGAVAGALVASGLLFAGWELRWVFAASLLPGLAALALIAFAVRDVEAPPTAKAPPAATTPPRSLYPVLVVVALSTISGAIDLFALARASQLGVATVALPLLWVVLHLTRSLLAAPLGRIADRLGCKAVIGTGLLGQALVLLAFATTANATLLWPLFALLGLHAAFTEGAERALVAAHAGTANRGTIFGIYHAVHGLAAFVGALSLGALWDAHGASAAFTLASLAAAIGFVALLTLPPSNPQKSDSPPET